MPSGNSLHQPALFRLPLPSPGNLWNLPCSITSGGVRPAAWIASRNWLIVLFIAQPFPANDPVRQFDGQQTPAGSADDQDFEAGFICDIIVAIGSLWGRTVPAVAALRFYGHVAAPYADAIRARMSSTRQKAPRPFPIFTGLGKRPDAQPCHHVDFETGMIAGISGTALGLPIIWDRRRKPVSGSVCILDYLVSSEYDAILIFLVTTKAEFGLMNTEFGEAVLFHAGFQRFWDFRKHFANGVISHRRANFLRQVGYLTRRTSLLIFDGGIITKRRDDG